MRARAESHESAESSDLAETPARVPIRNEGDIVAARQAGRDLARALGMSTTDQTLLATAISEVARNIVEYADAGEIRLLEVRERGARGIEVVAEDRGPGIADLDLAMRDGYSTGRSLGLGLPGARRLMDTFHIVSAPGEGTTITMRKWSP